MSVEDDALFRHKDLSDWGDPEQETPLEVEASEYGIAYVKLDGSVGCLGQRGGTGHGDDGPGAGRRGYACKLSGRWRRGR